MLIVWRYIVQRVWHINDYRLTVREKVLCLLADIVLFAVILLLIIGKPKIRNVSESVTNLSSDVVESFYSAELGSEVSVCRTCYVDTNTAFIYLTVEQCSGTVSIYKDSQLVSDVIHFDEGECLDSITGVTLDKSAECVLDIAKGKRHVKRNIFLEIIPEEEVAHD